MVLVGGYSNVAPGLNPSQRSFVRARRLALATALSRTKIALPLQRRCPDTKMEMSKSSIHQLQKASPMSEPTRGAVVRVGADLTQRVIQVHGVNAARLTTMSTRKAFGATTPAVRKSII